MRASGVPTFWYANIHLLDQRITIIHWFFLQEKILGNVSSVLAQMQSFYQSLCLSRNLMSKLLEEDKKSAGTI